MNEEEKSLFFLYHDPVGERLREKLKMKYSVK